MANQTQTEQSAVVDCGFQQVLPRHDPRLWGVLR